MLQGAAGCRGLPRGASFGAGSHSAAPLSLAQPCCLRASSWKAWAGSASCGRLHVLCHMVPARLVGCLKMRRHLAGILSVFAGSR
jgi:hypothetical protein